MSQDFSSAMENARQDDWGFPEKLSEAEQILYDQLYQADAPALTPILVSDPMDLGDEYVIHSPLLPRWLPPKSLDDAKIFIYYRAKNMDEHAYLLGRCLKWAQQELGTTGFEQWVEDNFWFSRATAYRMMAFAKSCNRVGRLLGYHPNKKPTLTVRLESPDASYGSHPYFVQCPTCEQKFPVVIPPSDKEHQERLKDLKRYQRDMKRLEKG